MRATLPFQTVECVSSTTDETQIAQALERILHVAGPRGAHDHSVPVALVRAREDQSRTVWPSTLRHEGIDEQRSREDKRSRRKDQLRAASGSLALHEFDGLQHGLRVVGRTVTPGAEVGDAHRLPERGWGHGSVQPLTVELPLL